MKILFFCIVLLVCVIMAYRRATERNTTSRNRNVGRSRQAAPRRSSFATTPSGPSAADRRAADPRSFLPGETAGADGREASTGEAENDTATGAAADNTERKRRTLPGTTMTARDAIIWGEIFQRRFRIDNHKR